MVCLVHVPTIINTRVCLIIDYRHTHYNLWFNLKIPIVLAQGAVGRHHHVHLDMAAGRATHTKCRGKYPGDVDRFTVPDDKVNWSVEWPEYKPVDYTAPVVEKGPIWADVDFRYFQIT